MRSSSLFTTQNTWLKLLILGVTMLGAILAAHRHLLLQCGLFTIYFLCSPDLYKKLLFAFRRLLPFLTAYWLFATLLNTDFIEMSIFSVRLILLIFATVYMAGTIDMKTCLGDTMRLRQYKAIQYFLHYFIATILFIKNYQKLNDQNPITGKTSLSSILTRSGLLIRENLAQAEMIETRTNLILGGEVVKHELISVSNLLGVIYLCLSMLLYSI